MIWRFGFCLVQNEMTFALSMEAALAGANKSTVIFNNTNYGRAQQTESSFMTITSHIYVTAALGDSFESDVSIRCDFPKRRSVRAS